MKLLANVMIDLLKTSTESIDEAKQFTEDLTPLECEDIDIALDIAKDAIKEAVTIISKYKAVKNPRQLVDKKNKEMFELIA